MTDEQVQQRVADYRDRYQVTAVNDAGFPVFPAGLRETPQHREWITLYQLFNRSRRRSGHPGSGDDVSRWPEACPVCLQPVRPPGATHQRCAGAVDLVRELGPGSLERVRAAAFPGDVGTGGPIRSKRKV
jgi:hypothetical protein